MLFQKFKTILQFHRCCSTNTKSMKKYLCVAEKNDAAKNIAAILSRGQSTRREGVSVYNKIYEFDCEVNGENARCLMTSVSGHVLNYEFNSSVRGWQTCNPGELFHAPIVKGCTEQASKVKRNLEVEAKYCHGLIIWTDCDREGENIGFEIISICEKVKRLQVFRAKFSEITAASIWRAIRNLGAPDKRQSDAVDVRSELDLRTGAAFTRLQTLRLQKVFPGALQQKLISYGSCQFPTLGFVVERYKAIENFIPEQFWQINLSHTIKTITTNFTWDRHRLFDKQAVLALFDFCLQANTAKIESVESKPKSKWRPVPLDTIEMEKIISRKMRINAKQIMKIAEKLYTSGYISYPRTETNIFPKEMNLTDIVQQQTANSDWGNFATRILNEGGPTPRQGKKSDQAHPPIHPTKYAGNLSGDEKRIYEYIVRHFLACVHKDATGHETIVKADCGNEKFTAKGLVVLERNYLDVYIYDKWNGKEINEYQVGDTFQPTTLEMNEGVTSPPKLLTEADLIALMEKHEIGTDATHAEHIETIKSRDYVFLQQNIYFVPAALGMGLVEGYNNMELQISLAKPNLRSEFENDLKLICEGRKTAPEVLRSQIATYSQVFNTVAQKMGVIDESLANRLNSAPQPYTAPEYARNSYRSVFKCRKCSADMFLKQLRGSTSYYLGCANYPHCKNAIWFTGVDAMEVLDEACTECGPNVRLLKVTFANNLYNPNPNTLCIGGCNPENLNLICSQPVIPSNPPTAPSVRPALTARNSSNNRNQGRPNSPTQESNQNSMVQSNLSTWMGRNSNNRNSNSTTYRAPSNSTTNRGPNNSSTSNITPNNSNSISPNSQICHCNQEAVILTCRNGVNAGRQFYKCKDNSNGGVGGCNYFAWKIDSEPDALPSSSNSGNTGNNSTHHQSRDSENDDQEKCCNCNLPRVMRTVSKEGPNKGRQFYGCAKPMGQNCNYFEWLDEPSRKRPRTGRTPNYKVRAGRHAGHAGAKRGKRKCGLCHREGHTRTTCPNRQQEDGDEDEDDYNY